jgi:hypothetical protein
MNFRKIKKKDIILFCAAGSARCAITLISLKDSFKQAQTLYYNYNIPKRLIDIDKIGLECFFLKEKCKRFAIPIY